MPWWDEHSRQREHHLQGLRGWEAFGWFKEEHGTWNGWRMGVCEGVEQRQGTRLERLVPGRQ